MARYDASYIMGLMGTAIKDLQKKASSIAEDEATRILMSWWNCHVRKRNYKEIEDEVFDTNRRIAKMNEKYILYLQTEARCQMCIAAGSGYIELDEADEKWISSWIPKHEKENNRNES